MIEQISHIMGGDGKAMDLVLEEWPGGRWFRDLGHGQGHLWGFVQVIKPPTLLEITRPTTMSYAVAGFLQMRLAANQRRHTHDAASSGDRDAIHRSTAKGSTQGWGKIMQKIKEGAEK